MEREDFIAGQHKTAPRFMALVEATTSPFQQLAAIYEAMATAAYDLDTARGPQLDTLGQWIGISRTLRQPVLGVFFTFDESTLGFDRGSWEGQYTVSGGITVLDDETYRQVLRIRALLNRWDGSAQQVYELSDAVFGPGQFIVGYESHGDMSVSIMANEFTVTGALLRTLLTSGAIPIRPAAVRLRGVDFVALEFGFGPGYSGFPDGAFLE